jgi:hypothetical protein
MSRMPTDAVVSLVPMRMGARAENNIIASIS